MRHYHKNKYIKKLNLFSKDAVKSLDTSGARYDTFTWNNIRDLGLYGDCKMKIGSLDFDTNATADVDIQAPVPPDDLVVHYKFDGDFTDSMGGSDLQIGTGMTTADFSDLVVKKGTKSFKFLNAGTDQLNAGRYGGKFTTPINWNTNTICFWSYQYANYDGDKYWNRLFDFGNRAIVLRISGSRTGVKPFNIILNNNTDIETLADFDRAEKESNGQVWVLCNVSSVNTEF